MSQLPTQNLAHKINLVDDFKQEELSLKMVKSKLEVIGSEYLLQVPIMALSYYRDYLYFSNDCLMVSMLAEQLHNLLKGEIELLPWEDSGAYGNIPLFKFKLKNDNIENVSQILYKYSTILKEDNSETKKFYEDFDKEYKEYLENLDIKEFEFPELVDHYYANLIIGAYEQYPEFGAEEIEKYPERKYGFWKSVEFKKLGYEVLSSTRFTDAWILSKNVPVEKLLESYFKTSEFKLYEATLVTYNNKSYLLNDNDVIYFPLGSLLLAKLCAETVDSDLNLPFQMVSNWFTHNSVDEYYESEEFLDWIAEMNKKTGDEKKLNEIDRPSKYKNLEFFISDFADFVLVKSHNYKFIFWTSLKPTHLAKIDLINNLSKTLDTLNKIIGIKENIKCNWHLLDDELFEELCYDIIYNNPKYDNSTIRKMGKSKSRDGGRDLVVYTNKRPGYSPKKVIIQCKYLKPGKSLTGSKILDISDTIDQFGAEGYVVMTSVVIDSTLYDKIDAIAGRKGIETENYSVYEIERILSKHKALKTKYFND